jgi:hypothetical protein
MNAVDEDWIRRFHLSEESVCGTGVFEVRRGERQLGRLIGMFLRFPHSSHNADVRVDIDRSASEAGSERWSRRIGEHRLDSVQINDDGLVRESFGVIELRMRQSMRDGRLRLIAEGAALKVGHRRLRLPRWCAPHASGEVWAPDRERGETPSFQLQVRIWVPCTGPLLSYTGHIEEVPNG